MWTLVAPPVISEEYWETTHPNSPLATRFHQIPRPHAISEEVHTWCDERPTLVQSISEEILTVSVEESIDQTA